MFFFVVSVYFHVDLLKFFTTHFPYRSFARSYIALVQTTFSTVVELAYGSHAYLLIDLHLGGL